ncbi:cytochrome C [Leptospira wolffii]|uniref:c-type cytochrome n=1 Tax=Leptospira wolffii TaxID=409998 RepID=UPI0010844DC3|nr:cytochrome c [Leptospira wolffii]TGK61780.1 cytochrome C [Leptospira wolffii]TGK70323.1 cytochrome C [Leptospira wolffii]TGK74932.1 cytochrome C [Leptospira wolffii]TGL30901.1 cytochrome C [Leptospira wolffii]
MKKILKTIGTLLLLLPLSLVGFLYFSFPKSEPAPEIVAGNDPARIERGRYLANHVNACIDCHSTRDWKKFSGPLLPETVGEGGEVFDQKLGFPGSFVAPNITPAALSSWTDGEILRAISSGISKDGRPLFPVMPHPAYGQMDKEDLISLIAYLRTLKPIEKPNGVSKADFPFNLILRTIPSPASFGVRPEKEDKIAMGKYLFTAAACSECHTKQDKGKPIAGMELAGGFEFPLSNGTLVKSANITPDKETGIGLWTEKEFVHRFKSMEIPKYKPHEVKDGELQTIMPWTMYAGMTEEDLAAIYAYLRTVKPISNKI